MTGPTWNIVYCKAHHNIGRVYYFLKELVAQGTNMTLCYKGQLFSSIVWREVKDLKKRMVGSNNCCADSVLLSKEALPREQGSIRASQEIRDRALGI